MVDEREVEKLKEQEKFKLPNKMTQSKIEKSEVKNSFGKRTRIQREDDQVMDEV